MIGPIHIKNFKSIRELRFEAKRVNVFIGEPNTGKSNIVEALALLSGGAFDYRHFGEIFRVKKATDLFFDHKVGDGLLVHAGNLSLAVRSERDTLEGNLKVGNKSEAFLLLKDKEMSGSIGYNTGVRYYQYKDSDIFPNPDRDVLNAPFGDNLVAVLHSNENLWRRVDLIIRSKGFRLELRPTESAIAIAKDVNDKLYSYAWRAMSGTLRRIIFFMVALETNRGATLLFDEPEANTFPFYTAYLAERIALDETNQFFLTTHNPYILSSIVGKTPVKDLAVFVTFMEDFATKIKQVSVEGLSKILDYGPDAFLNLDKLVEA
jgi:hypothetical protein